MLSIRVSYPQNRRAEVKIGLPLKILHPVLGLLGPSGDSFVGQEPPLIPRSTHKEKE